ncbi:polar amino acid ABC transporter, substrate-binding protein [Deferribacter desulfuricans SSM1]|uniref:Polar amino acid ABC transporter, substrate-binding protein n=1 Tax=Deferribacter desulfuricans (strain DSM 14783 / JCM 11476 / NBRC 101012 / SSM1) TaxID=639282 RepID=D3PDN3_DEFDS|nr:transporter substrate-binding domain-containing protein [Deferribacter desulfuricans]BAI80706.1 polar amino acid ABC transporter, substrate-binding protein [Deferribacter desulfuricans SSM1]
MKFLKKLLFLMIIFAFVAQTSFATESTLDKVLKKGVLKVGMSTFVPWAMYDKNGNLIGFEIDVAKRLAKDMGVKIEFVPTKWSGIIPALLTGKFDIIIGGMSITPQRALKVNFSIPYDYSGMSIVANKFKAKGWNKLSDFNKKNVIIAVRIGTTAEVASKRFFPNAKIKLFDDESQAIQELLLGRAHAVVASAPMPAFQAIEHPDRLYLPIKDTFTKEPIGFAVRKGDYDFLNFLNSWIRYVKAEGFLKERKQYWFYTRDWEKLIK